MTIFNPLLDRLLKFDRPDRSNWLRDLHAGIEFMPAAGSREPMRTIRTIARHDVLRRFSFAAQARLPKTTSRLLHAIPVRGPIATLHSTEHDRPIIIALAHYGPSYVTAARLRALFGDRSVYAVHLDGPLRDKTDRFLRAIGIHPIASDVNSLRKLAQAMINEPHCVAIIGYDFLGGRGRQRVRFLDLSVAAPRGLPYVADQTNADVFTAWLEIDQLRPAVVVTGPYRCEPTMESSTRQTALTQRIFDVLEERIVRAPEQWTEWPVFAWDHVAARTERLG